MAYYGQNIGITARGTTDTEFTSASFKATVITEGSTGPEAKEKALPIIERIKKAISGHASSAGIDTTRLKTTFDVDIRHDRHTGNFAGYKATYTVAFKAKNVGAATSVHDTLTSIVVDGLGVQAPTPIFNIDDSPEVRDRAFTDAVSKMTRTWQDQCRALKLDEKDFFLRTWTIQEERPHGKVLSIQVSEDSKPTIEPGKASFDTTVIFVWARKGAESLDDSVSG
jgi:uncharacterized protein YggE